MIIKFKYGFKYKGFNFGWKDQGLCRLPSVKNNKSYPFKKLNKIDVGNKKGYRVVRDKKSVPQLVDMTEVIDFEYKTLDNNHKDLPKQ